MKGVCAIKNYSDKYSGKLNFTQDEVSGITNLQELKTLIENKLKVFQDNGEFSLSYQNSKDPINYDDSIIELANRIDNILSTLHIPEYNPEYVKDFIIKKYSRQLTENEKLIQRLIPGIDITPINIIENTQYTDEVSNIFGIYIAANQHRLNIFNDRMKTLLIIDVENEQIIDSVRDINDSIITYLEKQFNIIKDYLKAVNLEFEDINIFRTNELGIKELSSDYMNIMQLMYHYLRSQSYLQDTINQSWMYNATTNGDRGALFHAASAYLNILYFDNILQESLGDYISINKRMSTPILRYDHLGQTITRFKYTLNSKQKLHSKNNWDDSIQDSVSSMGKFQKVLISSIPIRSYTNPDIVYRNMEGKDFISSISMLFNASYKISKTSLRQQYFKALLTHRDDMQTSLEYMLSYIFDDITTNESKSIITELTDKGLDVNTFNNLFSIYTTLFKGYKNTASWNSIEQNYIAEKGYSTRIPIIDTLLGVADSNVYMQYLQTIYNKDSSQIETVVKSRIASNSNKFDIINFINNDSTVKRNNKLEILQKYPISRLEDTIGYRIELSDKFSIIAKVPKNRINILQKRVALNFNEDFNYILNNIPDISEISLRDRLIDRKYNTQIEESFMKLLEFLDNVLGTDFSYSSEGLLKLQNMQSLNSNNLKLMTSSAIRALVIIDIYSQFETANVKGDEDAKYSINNIQQFLKDYENVFPSKAILSLQGRERNEYFFKNNIGEHLSTVKSGDTWIDDLAKVTALLSGNSSVSVVPDLQGNKIPLISQSYLGAQIYTELNKQSESKEASSNLLFVNNPQTILNQVINTDISTADGKKKSVKQATLPELLHDQIVNKFIIPWSQSGEQSVYVQPTVYSDKTKFILYQIQLGQDLGINLKSSEDVILSKLIDTVGKSYKAIWNRVLEDYKQIFPEFIIDGNLDLDKVQNWLKTSNVQEFTEKANTANVTIYENTHYRNFRKEGLSINELLWEYSQNLYNDLNYLKKRIQKDKQEFIKILYKNRFQLSLAFTSDYKLDTTDSVTNMFTQLNCGEEWKSGNVIILAKARNINNGHIRDILAGEIRENEEVILNPILDKFFLIDNLLGNNLRMSLTGSEINHTIKTLSNFSIKEKDFISRYNTSYKAGSAITYYDLDKALKNASIQNSISQEDQDILSSLRQLYENQIYSVENAGQLAQFKRNVIIPGTMRYYFQNSLYGILDKMNIAIIDDVKASVFNFNGAIDNIDAHDGSAFEDPFTSILENMSLQDSSVGTIKKPIHHWYDNRYMTATLLKYAVDTITNKWMIQSEGNIQGIRLRDIFKKMTNQQWKEQIDLFRCDYTDEDFDFERDILKNKGLFYREDGQHHAIVDFGFENGTYYTLERIVNSYGKFNSQSENAKLVKYYHQFDNNGTHYKDTVISDNPELHTINSLFELHTALGGIYSESINEDGLLDYSEASNYAVANWMNYVSIGSGKKLTQTNYYQPLKHYIINMVANKSAIKNGAGNINPVSSFYDNNNLRYITIGTQNYGIQLDADHEADEGKMTEFSQVISSLDAGGRLHEYVSEIYEMLGQVAINLSSIELNALKEFDTSGNKTALYTVVGKTIINNFRNNSAGLAQSILESVKKEFNLNSDQRLANAFIPFSDPNIYSTILSTFISNINKKSIKRQYPGQGTVMVPAYDISTIYDINGLTYQYEDILKLAIESAQNMHYISPFKDIALKNRDIVNWYLNQIQEQQNEITIDRIEPTDNILVSFTGERFLVENLDTSRVDYEIKLEDWAEDKNKPEQLRRKKHVINLYLKGQHSLDGIHDSYFQLVKDQEYGNYSVHFKTGNADTGEIYGTTKEQRQILFEELYKLIPDGALVSTYGKLSEHGRYALNKLMGYNLDNTSRIENNTNTIESERDVTDRQLTPIKIPIFRKNGSNPDYGKQKEHVSLNNITDYYAFKENQIKYLEKRGYTNVSNITFQKDITVPRNLAPARISWDVQGQHMNIFTHWRVKRLFLGLNYIKSHDIEEINQNFRYKFEDKSQAEKQLRIDCNVQQAFDELDKGLYVDESGNSFNITNLQNKAAEMITSNLFKTKFGIKSGDTLADIRRQGADYFKSEYKKTDVTHYDLMFTSKDDNDLFISFNPVPTKNSNIKYKKKSWKNNTIVLPMKEPSGDIIDRIVYVDNQNIPLFDVGRRILRTDVEYKNGKFIKDGNILYNQENFDVYNKNQVVERVYFIEKYEVKENRDIHTLFTLSYDNLSRVFIPSRKNMTKNQITSQIYNYLGKLLSDIYNYRDFSEININQKLSSISKGIMNIALLNMSYQFRYNSGLSNYVSGLQDLVKNSTYNQNSKDYNISNLKIRKLYNSYQNYLAQHRYTSFLKSQYFTVSRIPAQTLQSFMQMQNVGYTGVDNNQCFVSHWQTWLQGSDYDIDKAYVMGLSFTGDGRYVGWSNLFDLSTLNTLIASERLPYPKGRKYKFGKDAINIDDDIKIINEIEKRYETDNSEQVAIERINAYNALIRKLNSIQDFEDEYYKVSWTVDNGRQILDIIESHETSKIPRQLQIDSEKNFISSHIQNVVQNLRNMIGAYSPITIHDLKAIAENTPKGRQAASLTMLNPATKMVMQRQNIIGKDVIGIAANGEKVSFMWHYWINDVIKKAKTEEDLRYIKFNFQLSRLYNRHTGTPSAIAINTLPEVNLENLSNKALNTFLNNRLTSNITVDLMISQLLSAATDNAKELVLDKINCSSNFANIYLFLITLGFNVEDIVAYMTSPAISFIENLVNQNIFSNTYIDVDMAIQIAKGKFNSEFCKSFVDQSTLDIFKSILRNRVKEYINNKGENPFIDINTSDSLYKRLETLKKDDIDQFIDDEAYISFILGDVEQFQNLFIGNDGNVKLSYTKMFNQVNSYFKAVLSIKNLRDFNPDSEEINKDLDEFILIRSGAQEFTSAAKLLSINQGIKTTKSELNSFIQSMQDAFQSRMPKIRGEKPITLDVQAFLKDPDYKQMIIDMYNDNKVCLNIFAMIDQIPQYKQLYKLLGLALEVDDIISIKSKLFNRAYKKLKELGYFNISEEYQKGMLRTIDNAIITSYILNNINIAIPYQKGTKLVDKYHADIIAQEDGFINFIGIEDIESFKKYFEEYIIPGLKRGIKYDNVNGSVLEIPIDSSKNSFIKSLIRTTDNNTPLYKCNLNMLTAKNTAYSSKQLQIYVQALNQLKEETINGTKLSDLFMLYNLIVNKNNYGADRLTTLFESFIQNNLEQHSLIYDYLQWLGSKDFFLDIQDIDIPINELMLGASRIYTYEPTNMKDPSYIYIDKSGKLIFRIKDKYGYKNSSLEIISKSDSIDDYFEKQNNYYNYNTLGGGFSSYNQMILSAIENIDNNKLHILRELVKRGILNITKVCE